MEKQINLQDALALITELGLTVVSSDGEVKAKPKKKIRKRRPRGTGSVYSLSGNRSKPWVASVTIGYDDETGKQIQKPIGYFKTQPEALTALSAYELQNKGLIEENSLIKMNDIEKPKTKCPTFKEIWDIVFEKDAERLSKSAKANYNTAFNKFRDLHYTTIDNITLHDLQPIIDREMERGSGAKKLQNMKLVTKKIFFYAMKYDYAEKDHSKFIEFQATNKKMDERKPFTKSELELLINENTFESNVILLYIYTGLRPQELVNIKKEDIFIKEKYMIGGMKTESGYERVIPLHDNIISFVEKLYNSDTKYLLFNHYNLTGYNKYVKEIFYKKMDELGLVHKPYDTRHTFATLCNENKLDEFLIKKMIGHKSNDLTKDVYTHVTKERLIEEVNKIKIC